jgi:uncharacterized membrane protein YdjX (TVP38/TMEM64 family)
MIRRHWKTATFIVLITISIALYVLLQQGDYLSFESLKQHREGLKEIVDTHYSASLISFFAVYMTTAFFLPGAIALSIAGGFLFGVWVGALTVIAGATAGALLAFLSSRYLVRDVIQERFKDHLKVFNSEIGAHGAHYLFFLRIVPLMPFFVVNYLAGATMMSPLTFSLATVAGMAPGAFVFAFAGREIARINNPEDLLSGTLLTALTLIAVLAVLPVAFRHLRNRIRT